MTLTNTVTIPYTYQLALYYYVTVVLTSALGTIQKHTGHA